MRLFRNIRIWGPVLFIAVQMGSLVAPFGPWYDEHRSWSNHAYSCSLAA